MIAQLQELGLNTLWWLIVATFGAAALLIGWMLAVKGDTFWEEYETVYKETATTNMQDMFLFIDPHRLFLFNSIALLLVPLLVLVATGDVAIAAVLFVALLVGPFYVYRAMRQKRLRTFEQQLPDALGMVSNALSAGSSLNMALESLVREQPAPLSQEFMLFLREQRIGVEFDVALRNMERRLPIPDFQMFGAALRISREVGGNLGETLDTLAKTLRRKAAMEGKIESLTAQGKMQGYVMTALPIFLGVLLSFLEPEAMSLLFTTPAGWATVTVVVIMEALGYVFIRKVTRIDV